MSYTIVLIESEEGFAVGCPALPGCWSQGGTREEAIANIRDAICNIVEVKLELETEKWEQDGLRVETAETEIAAHA